MLEVMFSILILGIGLIAIASMFPVAGAIQKTTVESVTSQQVASNAAAKLQAKKLNLSAGSKPTQVQRYVPVNQDGSQVGWPRADRVFPADIDIDNDGVPNEQNVEGEDSDFTNRAYYWHPLYRYDSDSEQYQVFVIVMRKTGDSIPGLVNNNKTEIGEPVLQPNGQVVVDNGQNNPSGWHGTNGSTRRIIAVGDGAVETQ